MDEAILRIKKLHGQGLPQRVYLRAEDLMSTGIDPGFENIGMLGATPELVFSYPSNTNFDGIFIREHARLCISPQYIDPLISHVTHQLEDRYLDIYAKKRQLDIEGAWESWKDCNHHLNEKTLEAHVILNPKNGLYHVFFLPAREGGKEAIEKTLDQLTRHYASFEEFKE